MNIEEMTYKSLEWYVIKETNKEKLLLLKECMSKELIEKYFTNKNMVDEYYDVRFNSSFSKIWWEDSYIREILNGPFLDDLNKDELNVMRTTLKLGSKEKTTEDYVRLLTVEEARILPKEILKFDRKYGYWTMSPSHLTGSYARVWFVNGSSIPGFLVSISVFNTYGVRPVISLKSNKLKTEMDESDMELLEEMKRVIKL